MRGLPRMTLARQLMAFQAAIILGVLVAVGAVSLAQSEATFTRVEGRRIAALAELLAGNPLVRQQLADPSRRTGLATLAQTTATQSTVSTVTFAGADEQIRVSTDPSTEGRELELGSARVDAGGSWSGTMTHGGTRQLVSQVPVLDTRAETLGAHLGTVMVAEDFPSSWERLRGGSSYLLTYLGIASGIGLLGSWLLARRIKRQTLGLEPAEITGLAEHREALLYGIAEGVIALDPTDRVTLVNDVARRLLDLPDHAVGVSLRALRIEGRLYDVLAGVGDATPDRLRDQVVIRRGRVLVLNRMTVERNGRLLGTVTTLRDRTELARLERELGSFRSTTQLLRAQAHEFANQLHTISGLIQIEEYDEVVSYVDGVSKRRHALDLTVNNRVGDPVVAALLMAKSAQADERRVELRVSERTSLMRLDQDSSADVATVVGNLLDNALDAVTAAAPASRWVEIVLSEDQSTVEVVVSDSGPGVAPAVVQEVFAHGFTTKAAQSGERGIGLALTRLVCQRRGGEITLDGTADGGAVFTARMGVTLAPQPAASGVPR